MTKKEEFKNEILIIIGKSKKIKKIFNLSVLSDFK